MSRELAISAWALGLLICAWVLYPVLERRWNYRPNQPDVAAIATRVFYARVDHMHPIPGGVAIKANWLLSAPPRPTVVGSTFQIQEHHWSCRYTVLRIDPDGMVVFYRYGSSYRGSRGEIKLGWK
jgi:hypothetical protein